jgi:cell division protein FtsW
MSEQLTFDDLQSAEAGELTQEPRAERRGGRRKRGKWPFVELNMDVPLILTVFTLLIFGVLMVYSASWDFSLANYGDATLMFRRQLFTMSVGLVAGLVAYFVDYHFWRRYAVPLIALTVLGLLVVLIINEVRYGSARALSGGSYMPGEFAKVATILYLSVWLNAKRNEIVTIWRGLVPLVGIVGIMAGLILMQPDLSAAGTIVVLGGILFFLAGGDLKQIALMLAGTALLGVLVVSISATGRARMGSYFATLQDPTQANYHVLRSFEAFVKGGWFGVGLGQADTKLTGLPVPPTDSIFAVVGEELGLIGTSVVVILYGVILWRGLVIARRAPDMLGSLIAAGISIWITLEAFINMAVMVGLVPFAGNALPLVSFGGSNLVATLGALGILLNISRASNVKHQREERILDATARGRGGEWRGGLSRTRRAARTGRG